MGTILNGFFAGTSWASEPRALGRPLPNVSFARRRRLRVRVISTLVLLATWMTAALAHQGGWDGLVPVSNRVRVLQTPLVYNRTTGLHETSVRVRNAASRAIYSPLRLVVTQLHPGSVEVVGADGRDRLGRPYIDLPLVNGALQPRETTAAERIVFKTNGDTGRHRSLRFGFKVYAALTPANNPPVASAGQDTTAYVGRTVMLDGSASSDSDGDALRYRWSFTRRPEGSQAVLSDAAAVHPTFLVDRSGEYEIALVVSDSRLESAPDSVIVSTLNSMPTAAAGPDQTAFVGSRVSLDGSGSSDVDGDDLKYRWELKAKPETSEAVLLNQDTVASAFDVDRPGHYEIALVVDDGQVLSEPDTVFVDTENSRPVADAGPDQTAIAGSVVALDGSVSTDADGDRLDYSWSLISAPSGSRAVLADPAEAKSRFTPDLSGSYIAQLIVTDGQLESLPDTAEIAVAAKPNSPPQITSSPPLRATTGALYSYAVEAFDPDGDDLRYALQVSPDGMVIDPLSGSISWTPLDSSQQPVSVELVVTDERGAQDVQAYQLLVEIDESRTRVPSVIGLIRPVAELALLEAGLSSRNVSYEVNPLAEGTVIAQEPAAGGVALRGTDFSLVISLGPEGALPPDPETVAPGLDATAPTTTAAASEFLFSGANPAQVGVKAGTMEPQRVAVLRGRVLDRGAAPLPGVAVTIKDHAEYGRTLTRADGGFDLAANGGGILVLQFSKPGYLPAQRMADPAWQDYTVLEDVLLMNLDARAAVIEAGPDAPAQIAQGSVVADKDGSRQTSVVFPAGVQASMVLPDGNTRALSGLTVRATEYTVGEHGLHAMPGPLPPSSGYTYAVELSADEALAAGADTVRFDRAVPVYVDNFLGFPVGTPVPAGYYDRQKAAWIPSENGRVIKLLGITDQRADIDADGDGVADDAAKLAALGVTDAERELLAQRFETAATFWRVPVTHFTPWDFNWPYGPPADAKAPLQPAPRVSKGLDDPDCQSGSIIECQTQTLGEVLPIAGTALTLNYRSDRTAGRRTAHIADVPLTGAAIPPSLKRIDLEIQIAGQRHVQTFAAAANQSTRFTWDGKDAYGRAVSGVQTATVRIGYVYDAVYQAPANLRSSFAAFSGVPMTGSRSRRELTLWQTHKLQMGSWSALPLGFGGWSLNVHHVYDPIGHVLYRGDGGRQSADAVSSSVITTVAGGCWGGAGNGGPATKACLDHPNGVAATPSGGFYIADNYAHVIRYVDPKGIINHVAGTWQWGFSGDGGPAINAKIAGPGGIAVGPDGSLYFSDRGNQRIRKIDPAGIISTVAGNGVAGLSGDGGPATQASLNGPERIAVSAEGAIYFADSVNTCIRKVSPGGVISEVTACGTRRSLALGIPARSAALDRPSGVAVAPDGSVYIAASYNNKVLKVGLDGILSLAGGTGGPYEVREGVPATQTYVYHPFSVSIGPDQSVYVAQENRLRRIGPDGIINTVVGNGLYADDILRDGGPPLQAGFRGLFDSSIGMDGSVLVVDSEHHRVRKVSPAFPGSKVGETVIPSTDGSEVYLFDRGRHVRTLDALNKAVLFSFNYDASGLLTSLTDVNGLVTTIERDALGKPVAIVAPFGQRTVLAVGGKGYLTSLTAPGALTHRMAYSADGLLSSFTDPEEQTTAFAYDDLGRLIEDRDAAGGLKSLSRNGSGGSYTVSLNSALGRNTRYLLEDQPSGTQRRRTTFPDGTWTEALRSPAGHHQTSFPDGTLLQSTLGGDPRFGMQAPITQSAKLTTGGLAQTIAAERTAALSNTSDPFSLTKLTDKLTVNGRVSTSVYDAATKTVTLTSAAGRTGKTYLDAVGRIIRSEVPGLLSAVSTYDSQGRPAKLTLGAGADERSVTFAYHDDGELSSVTDALGRTVEYGYDPAGRMVRQTLPDGREIGFGHDRNGNLVELTPPGRPTHRFRYTAVGLPEEYQPPAISEGGLGTGHEYDLERQPTRVTRPDGLTIDFAYDAAGRPASLTAPDGQIAYRYDPVTGKPIAIERADGQGLTFTYSGALPTKTTWAGVITGNVGFVYDNDFRVTEERVNDANPVAYQYDADSLLVRAGDLSLARQAQNGLLTGSSLGSTAETLQYNGFGEVVDHKVQANGEDLISTHYSYDKGGRIVAVAETLGAETRTDEYVYDTAGRLVEVKRNGATRVTYGYDTNGNRTQVNGATVAEHDDQDRLTRHDDAEYRYTANGERLGKTIGGATTGYRYDVFGNLQSVEVPGGGRIDYLVDGANRRIGKKVDGSLVKGWLYQDQLKPIAEFDGSGNLVSRYVYATRSNVPDYMIRGGNTYRIVADHLGSPRLVVNAADGTVIQRIDYDTWGKVTFDSNPGFQPFGFAGGLYDRDTGLVRFGARDYDPETGRFTAKDPILFAGGSTNLYGYVLNDPVNLIDPSGLWIDTLWDIGNLIYDAFRGNWCDFAADAAAAAIPFAPAGVTKLLRFGEKPAKSVEVVQRWMSRAELAATQRTGLLRGGKAGTHYVTDFANRDAIRARQRLSLSQTPEVRVTLEVPAGVFSTASKVRRDFNMPGGGMERLGSGDVPVRILGVD